jgi:hypothetical protein
MITNIDFWVSGLFVDDGGGASMISLSLFCLIALDSSSQGCLSQARQTLGARKIRLVGHVRGRWLKRVDNRERDGKRETTTGLDRTGAREREEDPDNWERCGRDEWFRGKERTEVETAPGERSDKRQMQSFPPDKLLEGARRACDWGKGVSDCDACGVLPKRRCLTLSNPEMVGKEGKEITTNDARRGREHKKKELSWPQAGWRRSRTEIPNSELHG